MPTARRPKVLGTPWTVIKRERRKKANEWPEESLLFVIFSSAPRVFNKVFSNCQKQTGGGSVDSNAGDRGL